MSARLLDGTAVAASIRQELQPRAAGFAARAGRPPGLGIVLVGTHAPSEIYVRNKLKAASDIGCRAELFRLSESATLTDVLDTVRRINADDAFDGILVQDPLPAAMGSGASQAVFDVIDPAKDVDGFTPVNAGLLVQGRAVLAPCTPSGVIALLQREGISMRGSHAVVIGRSDIVGKPMAMLLLHQHATVTICHSRTSRPAGVDAAGRHSRGRRRAHCVCPARARQAWGDRHRRRDQSRHRRRGSRGAVSGRRHRAMRISLDVDRSWSATCTRPLVRSLEH